MPTAIVTGASGILGRAIVDALGKDPKTWTTVHALSRSQKVDFPSNVKTQHVDLLGSAEDIAKDLGDIKPEYVFFAAYMAKDSEEEAAKTNGAMLENFLQALSITGASKTLKRVVLTTGAKQYGVHLGVPKQPMEESDRWLTGDDRPPNFYYVQQEILDSKAKAQNWTWVVTYPNDVIGVARGNFMNLTTALGIYAAINEDIWGELRWPGSPAFYTMFDCFTTAKLHADFNLWAALETNPKVRNQAFNVVNGDIESWQNLWPKLARKFDATLPETLFTAEEEAGKLDESVGFVTNLADNPPLREFAAERGLNASQWTKASRVEGKIELTKWAERKDVQESWAKLAKQYKLEEDAFEKATWFFLNFILGRAFNIVISMNKARAAGWTGHVSTWDSLSDALDQLADEKVLPPFKSRKRTSTTADHTAVNIRRGRDQ